MQVTTVGIDLAKHVFQVHGVAADGSVRLRRKLRRSEMTAFFGALPACLIGLEAALRLITGRGRSKRSAIE
jgi:transposase